MSNHVVTSLVPELLGKDALLNETVAEIERRALEKAERTSPKYAREKEVRRRGYARYGFLKGFKVSLRGVVYGLKRVTVSLPVMYRGGERVRTRVEEKLLKEERLLLRALLLPVLGGKLNAKLWTQELGGLQVRDRGREVREVEGREEGSS
jgi:putative transposase